LKNLHKLGSAVLEEQEALLGRWRDQVRGLVSAKQLDLPTLNDHIAGWLGTLAASLQALAETVAQTRASSPVAHGVQRFDDGFDIEEVVAEYNIMRDCVYDLAERRGLDLRGDARRAVDRVFDEAIGAAVKAFAASQAKEVQRRRTEHLAFVVHDLRTPLSVITFAAAILRKRLPPQSLDADNLRVLEALRRNATQLDGLVAQVLNENAQLLTELDAKVERRVFDLWPMIETLLEDLQPLAATSATRLINEVPDDLTLNADATLVRRIMQNLVANALGYAPDGDVRIGAHDPGEEQPVECWVTDNGAGIPADRLATVFDALETDPERDGTGFGLAIVKTFVEAHQGRVTVESIEGQGATFRFTLPRAAVLAEPKDAVQAVKPATQRS
jgi:two-component system, OmpR family, phosphate regulon sensor histidine kinase PhoR